MYWAVAVALNDCSILLRLQYIHPVGSQPPVSSAIGLLQAFPYKFMTQSSALCLCRVEPKVAAKHAPPAAEAVWLTAGASSGRTMMQAVGLATGLAKRLASLAGAEELLFPWQQGCMQSQGQHLLLAYA